jgi:hypothetical protein
MKPTLYLITLLLTIGLLNHTAIYGETPEAQSKDINDDWDALFDDDKSGHDGDRHHRRGRHKDGPERRGYGPRGDGDRHHRRGGPEGYGRGRGGGHVDPQELMEFLHKYEPKLATKLEKLKEEDSRKLRRQIRRLSQLYAPVMRQMERDPQMGQLSLDKVRVQLKIKNLTRKSKKENAAPVDAAKLKPHVDALFDTIIAQEEMRHQKMTSRMGNWDNGQERSEKKGNRKGKSRHGDPKKRRKELQANMTTWKNNKGQIVDQQVQRLLNKTRPFPWGRM